jgi:light-regulated signal transduction histidine kinase (bacteriophytochrome)
VAISITSVCKFFSSGNKSATSLDSKYGNASPSDPPDTHRRCDSGISARNAGSKSSTTITDARRQQNLLHDIERYLAADQPRGAVEVVDTQPVVLALLARWNARIDQVGAEVTLSALPPALIDRPQLNDLFEVTLDNALSHGRSTR